MKIKIKKIDLWCIVAPIPVVTLLTVIGIITMWEGALAGYLAYLAIYYFMLRRLL